jgi:hypothetical protein
MIRNIDSESRLVAHERSGAARSRIRKLRVTQSFPSFSYVEYDRTRLRNRVMVCPVYG